MVETGDATQSMPLHEAARAGSVGLVQMLLGNGARAESADRSGVTPLHHAASGGHVEVLTLLQQHGASVEAYSGETDPITLRKNPLQGPHGSHGPPCALPPGRDSAPGSSLPSTGVGTPLHWAAGEGQCSAIEKLIGLGSGIVRTPPPLPPLCMPRSAQRTRSRAALAAVSHLKRGSDGFDGASVMGVKGLL